MSEAADGKADQFHPLAVTRVTASSFNVNAFVTEVLLVGSQMVPGVDGDGNLQAISMPQFTLSMSAHAAKELALLLTHAVESIEKEAGELVSPWLKAQIKE